MDIKINDSNIFIFYGQDACEHFTAVLTRWAEGTVAREDWRQFRFYLVASEMPDFDLAGLGQLVNDENTRFFNIEAGAPDANEIYSYVSESVKNGHVHVHAVCSSGGRLISYDWITDFMRNLREINIWNTDIIQYLFLNRQGYHSEKLAMQKLLCENDSYTVLLGDVDLNGAVVSNDTRWMAVAIALPLASSANLKLNRNNCYSFGYSALNANNQELETIRRGRTCEILAGELNMEMQESLGRRMLLPDGADDLRSWLQENARRCIRDHHLNGTILNNIYNLTRMGQKEMELPAGEAINRLCTFYDLNMTKGAALERESFSFTETVIQTVMKKLRRSPDTCRISLSALEHLIRDLREIADDQVMLSTPVFPSKPFLKTKGKLLEHMETCRLMLVKNGNSYAENALIAGFASALVKRYGELRQYLLVVKKDDSIYLDGTKYGPDPVSYLTQYKNDLHRNHNLTELEQKYVNYSKSMAGMNFSMAEITAKRSDQLFYDETGEMEQAAWKRLITECSPGIALAMPKEFKGTNFFRILRSEFVNEDQRKQFFDKYLASGRRMFHCIRVIETGASDRYLVDSHFDDEWFNDKGALIADTDNAENLTVYDLGNVVASELLNDADYFATPDPENQTDYSSSATYRSSGSHAGKSIFGAGISSDVTATGKGNQQTSMGITATEIQDDSSKRLRLRIHSDGTYWLSWEWKPGDTSAYVEFEQDHERLGKVAVYEFKDFKRGNDSVSVTEKVLTGKPMPAGEIDVTVYDESHVPYAKARLDGHREMVVYSINNRTLRLTVKNQKVAERIMLVDTDMDGNEICYPLYAATEGNAWEYTELAISSAAKVKPKPGKEGHGVETVRNEK